MKINKNTYPFYGWDYSEFCNAWNLPYEVGDPRYYNMVSRNTDNPFDFDKIGPVAEECPDYFNNGRVLKIYLEKVLEVYYNNEYHKWIKNKRNDRVLSKVANDIRLFLSMLGNPKTANGYLHPMWLGMSKIELDEELVSLTIQLIEKMWD